MVIRIWSAPRCIDKADHLELGIGRRFHFSLRVANSTKPQLNLNDLVGEQRWLLI
jgi:hypothetical protein